MLTVLKASIFGLIVFTISTTTAMAACQTSRGRFLFQNETVDYQAVVDAGTSCNHAPRARGTATFSGISIVQRPANGTLTQTGATSARYTPKAGFTGQDTYSIRICGSGRSGNGCSTLRYQATVR